MLDLIRKGENNQAPTEVILQDLATMVGGPREDYTKVISGVLGSNGHKLSKTKIILPNTSALRVGKVKIFYEKHVCGFLIRSGWFGIVLEVS